VPADHRLTTALKDHQDRVIIPHCPSCSRPCCRLTDLVLDLDWTEVQTLYRIGSSKRAFDAKLRDGSGPTSIRAQDGRYFAHGEPCPAYGADQRCGVYNTKAKPIGCSDFPVYIDGDVVVADKRCEALDPAALQQTLRKHGIDTTSQPGAFVEFVELVPVHR
jgi:Fe-S-cluster containining protein